MGDLEDDDDDREGGTERVDARKREERLAAEKWLEGTHQRAKRLLKAEMQRQGVTYRELARTLRARGAGTGANEANVRNQVNRGAFSAAFFIECCLAMGSYVVRLGEPGEGGV